MLVGGGSISIPSLVSELKTGTWELSYLSVQRAVGSTAGLVILVSMWEAPRAQLCRHVFLSLITLLFQSPLCEGGDMGFTKPLPAGPLSVHIHGEGLTGIIQYRVVCLVLEKVLRGKVPTSLQLFSFLPIIWLHLNPKIFAPKALL